MPTRSTIAKSPRRCWKFAACLPLSFIASVSHAQMSGSVPIVPDTAPEFSTDTVVRADSANGVRTLSIDGGRFAGPTDNPFQNLFHSFNRFDLLPMDRAVFTQSITALGLNGPASVRNVVNRVTGGQVSSLNGALDSSQFPMASVFFINPAGIIVGPGFTATVNGSLYFSTASSLRFADGSQFIAQAGNGSTLSVSSPESFGFIGARAGDISLPFRVEQFIPEPIRLNPSATFHLSAANISFRRDLPLRNAVTRIAATGTRDAVVPIDAAAPLVGLEGDVSFFNGSLLLEGDRAGQRGANAALKIGAGLLTLTGTDFARSAASIQSTAGGDILIDVARFRMEGITRIGSVNANESDPNLLQIAVRDSFIANGNPDTSLGVPPGERNRLAQIGAVRVSALPTSSSPDLIRAGNARVNIIAPTATVQLNNVLVDLAQNSENGAGAQGSFALTANNLAAQDTRIAVSTGIIAGQETGNISLSAGQISFVGQQQQDGTPTSSITTGSSGARDGGAIALSSNTGSLSLTGTHIRSGASGTGRAGSITLNAADDVHISSSSLGSSATGSSGGAGNITVVAADAITVNIAAGNPGSTSEVTTFTDAVGPQPTGGAGNIIFTAKSINLIGERFRPLSDNSSFDRARISAQTGGPQAGGHITLNATGGALNTRFADVIAFTANGAGSSGNVSANAQDIIISGSTFGASTNSTGNSGSFLFAASRDFILSNRSFVSAATSGSGNAGAVDINFVRNARIEGGSVINSDLQGLAPRAGAISVTGKIGTLTLIGDGRAGNQASVISSSTSGIGTGGAIKIQVGEFALLNGGRILAEAVGSSPAIGGNINVAANSIRLDGAGSGIGASSNVGRAGDIIVRADAISLANAAFITTNSTNGIAGNIDIQLPPTSILFLDGSRRFPQITTTSTSASGGTINIASPFAIIARGSSIEALGPDNQAKITLSPQFLIRGFDRPNVIAIQGEVFIDGQSNDVTRGSQTETPEFADALRILVARCSLPIGTGRLNNLSVHATGPYSPTPTGTSGGCGR